jgi:hypothetical protein
LCMGYSAGGRWNILAPVPESVPDDHPVRSAVAYLTRLHNRRTWPAPSEVLARIVDDRRPRRAGRLQCSPGGGSDTRVPHGKPV